MSSGGESKSWHTWVGTIIAIGTVLAAILIFAVKTGQEYGLLQSQVNNMSTKMDALERIETKLNDLDLKCSGNVKDIQNGREDLKDHNRRIEDLERSRRRN